MLQFIIIFLDKVKFNSAPRLNVQGGEQLTLIIQRVNLERVQQIILKVDSQEFFNLKLKL